MVLCPPQLTQAGGDERRLEMFLKALQATPPDLNYVRLTNGQGGITFNRQSRPDLVQTTVVPVEWKGQLVQQLLDKKVPFTVRDPDFSWIFGLLAALGAYSYFKFVMLPRWSRRECPQCSELVHCSARRCRYCSEELLSLNLVLDKRFSDEDEEEGEEDAEDTDGESAENANGDSGENPDGDSDENPDGDSDENPDGEVVRKPGVQAVV